MSGQPGGIVRTPRYRVIHATCRGSNLSVGGVQGASGRGRKVTCPVCGRKVGMRPGRAGRLYPHVRTGKRTYDDAPGDE